MQSKHKSTHLTLIKIQKTLGSLTPSIDSITVNKKLEEIPPVQQIEQTAPEQVKTITSDSFTNWLDSKLKIEVIYNITKDSSLDNDIRWL